ncbi:MAG TPA: hypothetical protein DER26_02720, partial [Verrucomicrobia bacterium]|nr:hypothetical protein [Verrucomicrobiota bacterium]
MNETMNGKPAKTRNPDAETRTVFLGLAALVLAAGPAGARAETNRVVQLPPLTVLGERLRMG